MHSRARKAIDTGVQQEVCVSAFCTICIWNRRMAKLNAAQRNALPTSQFAGPNRSYPIEDDSHAANAKARAKQQLNKGKMSRAMYELIVGKANRKLAS